MNLSRFDLNLLRVLDALLDTGSTTLAGEKVGLSQPAVSAALRRLRAHLDDPLLVRQGQHLVRTAYADSLRDPVRDVLVQTEVILNQPGSFDPSKCREKFRISGSDFYAELMMPALAERLLLQAPGIEVNYIDQIPDGSVEELSNGVAEMVLLPRMAYPAHLESRRMHASRLVIIARQGHAGIARAALRPYEMMPIDLFCGLDHVRFSHDGSDKGAGDSALAKLGRKRRVVITMPGFSSVTNAVAGSDLIALIPLQTAQRAERQGRVHIYRAPLALPDITLDLVWHKKFSHAPGHSWLRDQIADVLSAMDDDFQADNSRMRG